MKSNDLLIFNLHRRYLNISQSYGGFSGIYLISAFVTENGFEAQAYAGNLHAGKRTLEEACDKNKVKVVGLYCDYENVTENIFLSKYVKDRFNLPVIVGGPQATALGKDFFVKSSCDAIVRYEGEVTVLELLQYFIDGYGDLYNIKGISFFKDNQVIINKDRDVIENLDALPFVDKKYSLDNTFRKTEASIMTGRGCPFHCAFCHEGHHTRKVRFRSIENVLKEVDIFLSGLPADGGYLLFTDDTFTLIPERVKIICEELKKRKQKFNFNWFCEGHIHTLFLHPEMIQYMANAGLQRIQLGIEAGTQKVLDYYRKNSTLKEIVDVIKMCKEAGISQIFGNIILGGPFYNRDTYEKDLLFAKKLIEIGEGTVELGVISYWPLPETTITKYPEEYGMVIKDYDFITSVSDFPLAETKELNIWDICELVKNMRFELRNFMMSQISDNKIPLELIKKWFYYYRHYHTSGIWFEYLASNRVLFNYYDCIYSGEAEAWDTVKSDIFSCHPMRMGDLCNNFTIENGLIKLYDTYTGLLERELLRYSTGKLSVKEIINVIKMKGELCANKETLESEVLKFYEEASNRHLIVFSRH